MKKLTNKWAVFTSLVSMVLLFGCRPQQGEHGLGSLPSNLTFTTAVNSNGYLVTAVNTTKDVIAYWNVPSLSIVERNGDSLKVKFPFPGTYRIQMLAVGHGGTDTTSQVVTTTQVDPDACSPTTALGFLASCTQKTWQIIDSTGGFAVGPNPGDGSWWTAGQGDMDGRPCATNDQFTFVFPSVANGLTYQFIYDNQGDFFDNGYLGQSTNSCEPTSNYTVDQAPFGPGTFTYSVSEGTGANNLGQIKVIGLGAHFGMEGVDNTGTGDHHNPVSSITYDIVSMKHTPTGDELVVTIQYQPGGWWTFTFKEKL
jgi:hypothetical protein